MSLILNGTTGLSDVDGTAAAPAICGTDTNTGIFFPAADTIAFAEGGAEAVRIDSSGNLLVGTTTSTNNIRLNQKIAAVTAGSGNYGGISNTSYSGTGAGVAAINDFQRSRGITDGSMTAVASGDSLGYFLYRGSDGTGFIDSSIIVAEVDGTVATSQVPGRLVFKTASSAGSMTERARIDSSGNLLVGTTSDPNGGGIAVYKSTNGATIANFQNTYAGSGGQAIRAKINSAGNNTSSYLFVGSSNNDVCYIYGNGNIVNSNNSYGTLSDVKLKENIVDATPKLAEVMQLKVRNFNLKTEPDHKQIGFIAQELEQVFPALIDNTTSPNDPDDVIKSIKTSVLVPILVKAIQELKAIVDAQATRITALEAA